MPEEYPGIAGPPLGRTEIIQSVPRDLYGRIDPEGHHTVDVVVHSIEIDPERQIVKFQVPVLPGEDPHHEIALRDESSPEAIHQAIREALLIGAASRKREREQRMRYGRGI